MPPTPMIGKPLPRLLRSCEQTEDQAELKKLQKQISKKFLVFEVDLGTVERACAESASASSSAAAAGGGGGVSKTLKLKRTGLH